MGPRSVSECFLKSAAGLKYAVICGLVSAVIGGVVADFSALGANSRFWTVVSCGVIGILFGLRFGIRVVSHSPSENPRGQQIFYALVLVIGALHLLIFASLITGIMSDALSSRQFGSIQVSRSHDWIPYLLYVGVWFTSGILGIGVGLAGLQWPVNRIRSCFWGRSMIMPMQKWLDGLPEIMKILMLFVFVSLPFLIITVATIMT